jgi:hypothetical protein
MDKIEVIKDFLTPEECDFYIKYIDSNIEKFHQTETSKRLIWLFGNELASNDHKSLRSNTDLSLLSDIESKVRSLFRLVEKTAEEIYESGDNLYVTSFALTKQIPGSVILLHDDTNGGAIKSFDYSSIIYLNTMKQDGVLEFPNLNYSYSPQAGDLVIFPSADPIRIHQVAKISEDRYSLPIFLTKNIFYKIQE